MIIRRLFLLPLVILYWSCANQTQPTGGPRDEDPPQLLSSTPGPGTLNFKSQTIQLEFNEMVKEDNLPAELIITPSIRGKFKSRLNRNRLTLVFDEPFADSTTYTLNFRESIKDVTESNPAEDLILVFSTGPIIDTLAVSGTVTTLLTNQPASDYTVALYSTRDTLHLFNGTPLYAIQSEEDGTFQFRNIKASTYNIFAWLDKNNDLKCQSENEPYAFLLNPLEIDSNVVDIVLRPQSLNVRPLTITSARQQGKYYEVRLSKKSISYSINSLNLEDTLYHHYIDEKKAIRIYNTFPENQQYQLALSALDSAGFTVTDTLEFTFSETTRPHDSFQPHIQSSTLKSTSKEFETQIRFNKPIRQFADSSWRLMVDSTVLGLSLFNPNWAWHENILTIKALLPDSLTKVKDLTIEFPSNSFHSIESDTSVLMTSKVSQLNPNNFGIIELEFDSIIPFKVHLLNDKGKFLKEYNASSKMAMEYLDANNYQIRILVDDNSDGHWQPGNFFQQRLHEPVYFFFDFEADTGVITLKKNWVLGPFTITLDVDN